MQFNTKNLKQKVKDNSTTIILVVLLIIAASWGSSQYAKVVEYQRALDNMYELSYYELVDSMENIDIDISKLVVSSSPGDTLELLSSISRKTDYAVSSLTSLPISHPAAMNTMAFLNTLGDYCRSLVKKGGEGLMISGEDYENLIKMRDSCKSLRTTLEGVSVDYDMLPNEEWDYYQQVEQGVYDPFTFDSNGGMDYPSIVYDGPFSDALIGMTPKGLSNSTCSKNEAREIASTCLNIPAEDIVITAKGSKNMDGYTCTVENGDSCFVSTTGDIIWMMKEANATFEKLSYEKCVDSAKAYLDTCGIDTSNLVDTWEQTYDGQTVVSFATVQDNAICYPDLIKCKVNMEDGSVLAMDALGYYMNHQQRNIPSDIISSEEAENTILGTIDVTDSKLCYIPTGGGDELLCYEFTCIQENEDYLIYINALDGVQERVYKVVDTMDGELVV